MEDQKNKFPYGYGKPLSDKEASENFIRFRPILLRCGFSMLLGLVSGFLNGQSSVFAEEIPNSNTPKPANGPAPAPNGQLVPVRPPAGHAFGVLSVGFICASAAASGNPLAIALAVAGCLTASIATYLNGG